MCAALGWNKCSRRFRSERNLTSLEANRPLECNVPRCFFQPGDRGLCMDCTSTIMLKPPSTIARKQLCRSCYGRCATECRLHVVFFEYFAAVVTGINGSFSRNDFSCFNPFAVIPPHTRLSYVVHKESSVLVSPTRIIQIAVWYVV